MDRTNRTFVEARAHCQQLGGDLAVFYDWNTTLQFANISVSNSGSSQVQQQPVWVGLTDSGIESLFCWVEDSVVTWVQWGPGQPDNGDNDMDCVVLVVDTDTGTGELLIHWETRYCNSSTHAHWSACQVPPASANAAAENCTETIYTGSEADICYELYEEHVEFDEAVQVCSMRGQLATIRNAAENRILSNIGITVNAYIGATDITLDSVYRWQEGSLLTYEAWSPGSPSTNRTYGCVVLTPGGLWESVNCNDTYPFICEYTLDTICSSPIDIEHASWIVDNQELQYTCHQGYTFGKNLTTIIFKCSQCNDWSSDLYCSEMLCRDPEEHNMTTILYDDTNTSVVWYVNSTVVYVAATGTRFDTGDITAVSYCMADGSWSPIPTIEDIVCHGTPAKIYGAIESVFMNTIGSLVTYKCSPGYVATGNNSSMEVTCLLEPDMRSASWEEARIWCQVSSPYLTASTDDRNCADLTPSETLQILPLSTTDNVTLHLCPTHTLVQEAAYFTTRDQCLNDNSTHSALDFICLNDRDIPLAGNPNPKASVANELITNNPTTVSNMTAAYGTTTTEPFTSDSSMTPYTATMRTVTCLVPCLIKDMREDVTLAVVPSTTGTCTRDSISGYLRLSEPEACYALAGIIEGGLCYIQLCPLSGEIACEEPMVLNSQMPESPTFTIITNLTLTCKTGFVLPGGGINQTSSCIPNFNSNRNNTATWSPPWEECHLATCPAPNVYHAYWSPGETYVINTTLTVACDAGYIIHGGGLNQTSSCVWDDTEALAAWTPPWRQCVVYGNGNGQTNTHGPKDGMVSTAMPSVDASTDSTLITPSASSAVLTTQDASGTSEDALMSTTEPVTAGQTTTPDYLSGIFNNTGTGSPTDPKKLICLPPSNIPNAHLFMTGYEPGHTAEFSCLHGYTFPDGSKTRSIVCQDNLEWHSGPGECIEQQCPPLPDITNAQAVGSSRRLGAVVPYVCDDGSLSVSGRREVFIICSHELLWSMEPMPCRRRCTSLPLVPNSFPEPYTSDVSSEVNMQCIRGHRFSTGHTSETFYCQDGQWGISDNESCEIDRCRALDLPSNSTANSTMAVYGCVVIVACDAGFRFNNTKLRSLILKCEEGGVWDQDLPVCQETYCPAVSGATGVTSNSILDAAIVSRYSARWLLTCLPGMRTEDGYDIRVLECQENGTWSLPVPNCDVGRCPPIPHHTHANPDSTYSLPGHVVRFTCHHGYVLPSSMDTVKVICDGGQWNLTEVICQEIACPPPPEWPNTNVNSTDTVLGTVLLYECTPGYKANTMSSFTSVCQLNGSWSLPNHTCQPISCIDPPAVEGSTNEMGSVVLGTSLSCSCFPGTWFYRGSPTVSVVCQTSGTWAPRIQSCSEITCLPLWSWDDAMEAAPHVIQVGAHVNFSCVNSTLLPLRASWQVSRCSPTGQWEPSIDGCGETITQTESIAPTEADQSDVIGGVAIGVMALVVGFVVVLDLISLSVFALNSK